MARKTLIWRLSWSFLVALSLMAMAVVLTKVYLLEGGESSRDWTNEDAAVVGAKTRTLLQALPDDPIPVVIADGGSSFVYPPMSEPAYKEAIKHGADYLLCRIVFSSDMKAVCRPAGNLTESTLVSDPGLSSASQYKLQELLNLKVKQVGRSSKVPSAFDNYFKVLSSENVTQMAVDSNAVNPKPVGIALEFPAVSEMGGFPNIGQLCADEVKAALSKLQESPLSKLIVIVHDKEVAEAVRKDFPLQKLLVYLADVTEPLPEGLSPKAQGVVLNFNNIGYSEGPKIKLFDQSIPEAFEVAIPIYRWNTTILQLFTDAGLEVFLSGFDQTSWGEPSSESARFNTYEGDPVRFYQDLLWGNVTRNIHGLIVPNPGAAVNAAVCYKNPVNISTLTPPTQRPYILPGGGSQGRVPSQTILSYLLAIKEGADIIDCNVRVSQDRFLFCHSSKGFRDRTNTAELPRDFHWTSPDFYDQDVWPFHHNWSDIQKLRVKTNPNYVRQSPFTWKASMPSLDEFFEIAKNASNASRKIGVFIRVEGYIQLLKGFDSPKPLDLVSLLLQSLANNSFIDPDYTYIKGKHPLLWIGSVEQCVLQRIRQLSPNITLLQKLENFTKVVDGLLDWREPCELFNSTTQKDINWWTSKEGLSYIKTYADGISPNTVILTPAMPKSNQLPQQQAATGFYAPNPNLQALLQNARDLGLLIVPKALNNEAKPGEPDPTSTQGSYDILDDPNMDMQYYYDQLNVYTVEAQMVYTAANFLSSSCRWNPPPGFVLATVDVPKYYNEIIALNAKLTPGAAVTGKRGKRGLSRGVLSGVIVTCTLLFVVICGLVALLCFRQYNRKKARELEALGQSSRSRAIGHHPQLKAFSAAELIAATKNFDPANKLGKGGAGTVFKGVLADGTEVAVKKLDLQDSGSHSDDLKIRTLGNELAIIGAIRHRHVVELKGYSIEKDWLLVYEYLPNGSVMDALFRWDYPCKLSWQQWFKIVLGTAKGIAYLHHECSEQIIHRDIKPSNILLDNKFEPHVADFGIAKNTQIDETHVTTAVMGTFGYMAPDYASTGQLTAKSDVYSFGVLALVIISQRPLAPFPGCGEILTLEQIQDLANKGGQKALLEIVSPNFEGQYKEEAATRWLCVALLCVQAQPALRPTMEEVVQMLEGHKAIPTNICVTPAKLLFPKVPPVSESNTEQEITMFDSTTASGLSGLSAEADIADFDYTNLEGR